MKKIFPYCLAFILSLIHLANLSAQDSAAYLPSSSYLTKKPSLNGYVRGIGYGGAGSYDYSNIFGEISLLTSLKHQKLQMRAELRFRDGAAFGDRINTLEIREAWAGYSSNILDLRLGNQIIKWGRTDGFNPTNCITPTNYFILTDEHDDQRMSNFLLQATIKPFRSINLTAIFIPFYRPSTYRYELFDMGQEAVFIPAVLPRLSFGNAAYALKTDFRILRADMSLAWFDGYNPDYGFLIDTLSLIPSPEITYRPEFYRKKSIGADIAVPAGRTLLRAEAALNLTEDYKNNMHIPNPGINYVAGIEKEIDGVVAILQYIGSYTSDFKSLKEPILLDPTELIQYATNMIYYRSELFNRKVFFQQEKFNHAVSLTLTRSFAYQTVNAEASGYYNITSEEYFARGSLSWLVADNLKLSLGGSVFNGPDGTIFSYAGKVLSGAFMGLKVQF